MFTPSPASTSTSSSSNEDSGHVLRSTSSVYHLGPSSSASAYLGPSAASGRTAAYRRRSLQSLNTFGSSAFVSVAIGICRYLRRQNYVEYEIMCRVGGDEWSVCRRYSRIRQFHEELRKHYPEIKSIPFPSRTPFWVDSSADAVAESRVTELQAYFQHVITYLTKHPYCLLNPRKSRVPICRRIVCQVLPILRKGEFETNRFGTA